MDDAAMELLAALTQRVRVFSRQQASAYWAGNSRAAARSLSALARAGYVRQFALLAHPLPELEAPLLRWRSGDPKPDFRRLARLLRSRFWEPVRSTACVIATSRAAAAFGGFGGRLPRPMELTHDLALSQVYLRTLRHDPSLARTWVAEAQLAHALAGGRGTIPDARLGSGGEERALELGGQYSREKLERFHEGCASAGSAYEIW